MTPWYRFVKNEHDLYEHKIIQALEGEGIFPIPYSHESLLTPGLFFFDHVTPKVIQSLRAVMERSIERVIAISTLPSEIMRNDVWLLLQAGASDVFSWTLSGNPAQCISARLLRWENIEQSIHSNLIQKNLIGKSPVWRSALRQIVEVGKFTRASALITGETGTGKELAARLIHSLDPRPNKGQLVVVDCTTIVPELSGSEFFGHEKGAFTGAFAAREGAFSLADGGTLFLDEVGELPLRLQAELLRVIQEKTYKRVGSNRWEKTNFRLVCATNRNLIKDQQAGQFRQDLYYRLTTWPILMPPLRERKEDILALFQYFSEQVYPEKGVPKLDDAIRNFLLQRDYPGNVRDLKQLATRITHRHVGPGCFTFGDIPKEEWPNFSEQALPPSKNPLEEAVRHALSLGTKLKEIGRKAEEEAIRITVNNENGNLKSAAQKLGVTDRALQLRRAAARRTEEELLSSHNGHS